MTRRRPSLCALLVAVFAACAPLACHAAKPLDKPAPEAARLVRAALKAELASDSAQRDRLLSEARTQFPNDASAHWQSGEVYFEGQWRRVDDVSHLIGQDPRWPEYRQLREESGDSPDDHYALARWCSSHNLSNEARYHWARVLLAVPDHEEARQRLNLRQYNGGLYTDKQIAAYEQARADAEKSLKRFKPVFLDIRRRAEHADSADREAALEELCQVSDPAAMDALADITTITPSYRRELIRKMGRDEAERFVLQLNLAAVSALGNMLQHEATVRLVNCAVCSSWPESRTLATELLKPRPKTDYVPLLVGNLMAPIELDLDLRVSIEGVSYTEQLRRTTPEGQYSGLNARDSVNLLIVNQHGQLPKLSTQMKASVREALQATQRANQIQEQVAFENASSQARNLRIKQVLKATTNWNVDLGAEPEIWWQAWRDENELYYDEGGQPQIHSYDSLQYYVPTISCFAAGTPVWTQAGPAPIETISVGDMVLSQDPTTGELAYRAVLVTTVRPPSATVALAVKDETIVATLGHRFWINGRGWEMAKALKSDAPLHSLDGPVPLRASVQSRDSQKVEAHNLTIDEFHTYFVGKSRLLVHDNSCPRPTLAAIPGLAPADADRPPK